MSRPMPWPNVSGVVLKGGTSTTGRLVESVGFQYACSLLRGGNGADRVVGRSGTLLGPEGTATWWVLPWSGPSVRSNRRLGCQCFRVLVSWWVGAGLPQVAGGCLRTAQWTRASLNDLCGQVFKCTGWMPWHQEPKKDVVACDKPRGVGKRTVIRGFPNGETPHESCRVTRT